MIEKAFDTMVKQARRCIAVGGRAFYNELNRLKHNF